VFKSFSALALFAAVVGAQAQTSVGEASRAAVDTDRGRLGVTVASRDVVAKGAACGGAGQAACAKTGDSQVAERVPAGEPDALALAWAALGVVAFVALRRRPR
jgi:MYXO-CTERM domain-containing protein